MDQSFLKKVRVAQLFNKFLALHGTRKFGTVCQPLVPIMSQMNPIHAFPPYLFKIHSHIILPYMPASSKWPPPFRSSD